MSRARNFHQHHTHTNMTTELYLHTNMYILTTELCTQTCIFSPQNSLIRHLPNKVPEESICVALHGGYVEQSTIARIRLTGIHSHTRPATNTVPFLRGEVQSPLREAVDMQLWSSTECWICTLATDGESGISCMKTCAYKVEGNQQHQISA